MELPGPWRALAADDEQRRDAVGLDCDDSAWPEITVPGHWRANEAFAESDGPLVYRTWFSLPRPDTGRRRWVTFNGIFYQADVWLDGAYLGDPEGYFIPHSFDITALSRLEEDHVVAVEVACHPERGDHGRRNVTGIFQSSEAVPAGWNPGGIWRHVAVYDTGPVKIDRLRVLCRDADDSRAFLSLTAVLDSDSARTITLVTTAGDDDVTSVVVTAEHSLATGTNEIEWTLDIKRPDLWWPRALGDQPLYDIVVDVQVGGEHSDRRTRRTGLREVAWSNWVCSVNRESLFLKGANYVPTRPGLADADPQLVRADVAKAIDAGLDALRVQAHIGHPELYRAADEAGLLILQDFPLHHAYARSVRSEAVRQSAEAVNSLGHHPSIVRWSAHDEPVPEGSAESGDGRFRRFVAQQLPTWNRSVLDRWVKRTFERCDPTRMTVAHGGVMPHLPQLDGTESHLWAGWYSGEIADLATLARRVPRLVRFVTEFGAQSVPEGIEAILDTTSWPVLDRDVLEATLRADVDVLAHRFPPGDYTDLDAWREATQEYQARLLARQIRALRRLKYSPTGGFCFSWLADPAPLVAAGVLDAQRRPKRAWQAVVDACAPVVLAPDALPDFVEAGDVLSVQIHVVNDLRDDLEPCMVTASWTWPGGHHERGFIGSVTSDSCSLVGTTTTTVPDTLGELALVLTLTTGHGDSPRATYRQVTAITIRP